MKTSKEHTFLKHRSEHEISCSGRDLGHARLCWWRSLTVQQNLWRFGRLWNLQMIWIIMHRLSSWLLNPLLNINNIRIVLYHGTLKRPNMVPTEQNKLCFPIISQLHRIQLRKLWLCYYNNYITKAVTHLAQLAHLAGECRHLSHCLGPG